MVSFGLRYCRELGLHLRKPDGYRMTPEDEMKRRSFWVFLGFDRHISSFLGRTSALVEEDYDVDLPVECDDEFWENPDPELAFKQPPGRPSLMAYFNSYVKLSELLGFTLRTLYSTKKSKLMRGFVGNDWEQRAVADLDSALNNWLDSVPDHLRWDPHRENEVFFRQSCHLYCTYYTLQIQIHRTFIKESSPQGLMSLAICVNAARSCSHVLEALLKRGSGAFPTSIMAAFSSGLVLIINMFGGRNVGLNTQISRDVADVEIRLNFLHAIENRWSMAGRLADLLQELSSVKEFSFPPDPPSRKRDRDETDGPLTSSSTSIPARTTDAVGHTHQSHDTWQVSPLPPSQLGHQAALHRSFSLPSQRSLRQEVNYPVENILVGGDNSSTEFDARTFDDFNVRAQPSIPSLPTEGWGSYVADISEYLGCNQSPGLGVTFRRR